MITQKQQSRINSLLNTSVDDCRISLQSVNDLLMLKQLLIECQARENTSRAQAVQRRINKLTKQMEKDFECKSI